MTETKSAENVSDAALLSALAALSGYSVPEHRFTSDSSAVGKGSSLEARCESLRKGWRERFSDGTLEPVTASSAQKGPFPLLWVSKAGVNNLVVTGFAAGKYSVKAEDQSGERQQRIGKKDGQFLAPVFGFDVESPGLLSNKSATDWFSSAVRAHRSIFVEAVFATLLISLIGLATAMYTMQVYDRVVPTKGYATLLVLLVGVLVAMLFEFISKQVRAGLVDRACKAIDKDLSSIFFGKALDIRLDARPSTVGTFASQVRHFESVRNFMTSSTLFIFADIPFALFFIAAIALIGGQVALVPLVLVPISLIIGLSFRGSIERLTAESMTESNKKNGLLIEAIDGVESVKASNAEWKMLRNWAALTDRIAETDLRLKSISAFSSNLTQTLQQVSYVGMITVGAYLITLGELTMGALIACSIIGGRALAPLAQIPSLLVQWKQAKISLDVLDGIMALPGERESGLRLMVPGAFRGNVHLDAVTFHYGKEIKALDIPQLHISAGERVAIIGPIGSGKSSLLKLIAGLYRPNQGRVFIDDLDIALTSPEFLRSNVGYLPQDVRLFDGSLRDNLTLGLPAISDSDLLQACTATGLDRVVQGHPKGLELRITEGGRGLSGGQRQLVGLTRLLLMHPNLVLLDEPTASMDAQSERQAVDHLFNGMSDKSTIVVVTHKMAVLPFVDRVIVVDKGQVVLDGSRNEVMQKLRNAVQQGANSSSAGEAS